MPSPTATVRLFVGWPLPDAVRQELATAVAPLRATLPRASWARPETYHVTFAFLGDHVATVVPAICRELDAALAGVGCSMVVARGSGFFPSSKRPRVGWIAIEPEETLRDVAARVRVSVRRAGLTMDDKLFASHLTLVRIRDGWPSSAASAFTERLGTFRSTNAPFESVSLFSSRLDPNGAIHTELHRVGFRSP